LIYQQSIKKDNVMGTSFDLIDKNFIAEIKEIVSLARQKAYTAINTVMVESYWQMGKRIVEQEQKGEKYADYGKKLIKSLSEELTNEFGKGFSVTQIYYYRQFYLSFPEIFHTPCGILSWSHYRRLMSVQNENARNFKLQQENITLNTK